MNGHFAYYNEIDPHAAEWLRRLVSAGHIAPGYVDQRSIVDIEPADLDGFTQCHFFAGVGIWSHALRSAGWGDDQPVWTGSCPCQPFSAAGSGAGFDDERHLWPHWHWLIQQCRPQTVFGEQVASRDGLGWLDLVSADLEASDFALGPVDTCAAGFGAFHIRQRLYFAAENQRPSTSWLVDAKAGGWDQWPGFCHDRPWGRWVQPADPSATRRLVNDLGARSQGHGRHGDDRPESGWNPAGPDGPATPASPACCMADTASSGSLSGAQGGLCCGEKSPGPRHGQPQRRGDVIGLADTHGKPERGRPIQEGAETRCAQGKVWREDRKRSGGRSGRGSDDGGTSSADTRWPDADWLFCSDGRWRPVEPGTFPLADGSAGRLGRLRAYGNGLDARQATGFVRAFIDRGVLDAAPAGDLFEWGA